MNTLEELEFKFDGFTQESNEVKELKAQIKKLRKANRILNEQETLETTELEKQMCLAKIKQIDDSENEREHRNEWKALYGQVKKIREQFEIKVLDNNMEISKLKLKMEEITED